MRFTAIQSLPAGNDDKVVTPRPILPYRQLLRLPSPAPPIIIRQNRTHPLVIRQTRPVPRDLHGIRKEEVGVDGVGGDECRIVGVPYEA
jgi:hypothetical protein